jgi:hypothetical protein
MRKSCTPNLRNGSTCVSGLHEHVVVAHQSSARANSSSLSMSISCNDRILRSAMSPSVAPKICTYSESWRELGLCRGHDGSLLMAWGREPWYHCHIEQTAAFVGVCCIGPYFKCWLQSQMVLQITRCAISRGCAMTFAVVSRMPTLEKHDLLVS